MPAAESLSPSSVASSAPVRRIGRRRAMLVLGALVFASAASLSMVAARSVYLHRVTYLFLLWNLILAWIPLACAFAAYRCHVRARRGLLFWGGAVGWFVFFPNAPYIVTDFVHLEFAPPVPRWFDLMTIASFAWTGLCLGYLSLYLMQEIARARLGRRASWVFVVATLAVSSVGIYLGRFLRWNSWQVFSEPLELLHATQRELHTPGWHLRMAVFVGMVFLFLLLSYCATFALTHLHEAPADGRGDRD